jgi:hypothetical protein
MGIESNITVSSGGGYFMLPLSAAESNYTVIAEKDGLLDIEREILIINNENTNHNFSLRPDLTCPLSGIVQDEKIDIFYQLRDRVFSRTDEGKRWIALYYRHAGEVNRLIIKYPGLKAACSRFIKKAVKYIVGFDKKRTLEIQLEIELLKIFGLLIQKGSPELKASLEYEKNIIMEFLQNPSLRMN